MKHIQKTISFLLLSAIILLSGCSQTRSHSNHHVMEKTGAFLEISLKVNENNREKAAGVYLKYKEPFLKQIKGAQSKELLVRGEDVQVLHGFTTEAQANAYLQTSLFSKDIVGELGPLLSADPEVRIYTVFTK